MKKGVRIINCARGELIDDAALVDALKSGQVAGAALDVFTVEPPRQSPYFGLDNVILTPHIAGSTGEAQEAVGIQIARQVRDYLKLGVVQNAVNLPSLTHEEYVVLAPYIDLAGRLGSFLAQAGKGGIEAIDLVYGGDLAEAKTELVRNAAIEGLLQGSENVNRINATAVAQERGIRVHEEKQESHRGGAATVLTIELHGPAGISHASATVIHGEQPRLLEFDGIDIETPLEGNLLVCRNLDVRGRDREDRNHPGRAGREHRQLRPGPRAGRRQAGEGAGRGAGGCAGLGHGAGGAGNDRGAARSQAGDAAGGTAVKAVVSVCLVKSAYGLVAESADAAAFQSTRAADALEAAGSQGP